MHCISEYCEKEGTAKHCGITENFCDTGSIEGFHFLFNKYSPKTLQSSQVKRLFQTIALKSYRNLVCQKSFMSEIVQLYRKP